MLRFDLPYPPSVNTYWRHNRGRTHVSTQGKRYQTDVLAVALQERLKAPDGPLSVSIAAYPPDERNRDADNLCKSLFDAMTKAGIISDDGRKVVRRLCVEWCESLPKFGKVSVEIQTLAHTS